MMTMIRSDLSKSLNCLSQNEVDDFCYKIVKNPCTVFWAFVLFLSKPFKTLGHVTSHIKSIWIEEWLRKFSQRITLQRKSMTANMSQEKWKWMEKNKKIWVPLVGGWYQSDNWTRVSIVKEILILAQPFSILSSSVQGRIILSV